MNDTDKEQWRYERKEQRLYEKRVRWQKIRIEQFGYVNYLILTLASGASAFGTKPLIENDNSSIAAYSSALYWFALLFFFASVIAGIVCAHTRLCDFQKTALIAKLKHERGGNDTGKDIKKLRCKTKMLGKRSWQFLHCQMIHFSIGIILFAAAVTTTKNPLSN